MSAIITFSLIIFSSSAGFILAQSNNIDYVPLAPLPGTTKDQCSGSGNALDMLSGSNDCTTNFATYLPGAFNFIVGLSAVLAFVVLTYGGVLYMTSDAINNKKEGRKYIENALWGLGLVLASYVILYTINPQILSFKLKLVQPETSTISVVDLNGIISNVPMASSNLNGYNIAKYDAGEPAQAALVQSVYNNNLLQSIPTTSDGMNEYISKYFPDSAISGSMVKSAADKYNVDPKLIMAFMQAESAFGTKGLGATTNNPGNIGNITGSTSQKYNTWQDGVNAIADWLNKNRS